MILEPIVNLRRDQNFANLGIARQARLITMKDGRVAPDARIETLQPT